MKKSLPCGLIGIAFAASLLIPIYIVAVCNRSLSALVPRSIFGVESADLSIAILLIGLTWILRGARMTVDLTAIGLRLCRFLAYAGMQIFR